MAKTIENAHLALAYRLGSVSVPSSSSEKAKRLQWFVEGINNALADGLFWFMLQTSFDTTVADQGDYDVPEGSIQVVQVKVDDYLYDRVDREDVYEKYEAPLSPVPILPSFLARSYYDLGEKLYFIPVPASAPKSYSVTLSQTGGLATAVASEAHGFVRGQSVTIAGADQAGYNGAHLLLSVPTSTTFTFSVASSTTSPATGTITATRQNIEIWHYKAPTEPTGDSSSIVVPDRYLNIPVAYAEGRYWSAAHKRAKAADAFLEYETLVRKLRDENTRRKFYTGSVT